MLLRVERRRRCRRCAEASRHNNRRRRGGEEEVDGHLTGPQPQASGYLMCGGASNDNFPDLRPANG